MDSRSITYCVTVADERKEIERLINFLLAGKREGDDIVVLSDLNKRTEEVEEYLHNLSSNGYITLKEDKFDGDFANWKNKFFKTIAFPRPWFFFIDADEVPNQVLIDNIHTILGVNKDVAILGIPRENTVEGITKEHLQKWRWSIDKINRINYPDYQYRICKSDSDVRWKGKVHETLVGEGIKTQLPGNMMLDLYHPKTISKQELQNNYYNGL